MRLLILSMLVALPAGLVPGRASHPTEEVVVSGHVRDATDGSPLAGVHVFATGHRTQATTDTAGFYRLRLVGDDLIGHPLEVRVLAVGFGIERQTVTVATVSVTLDFHLAPALVSLDEIVVTNASEAYRSDAASGVVQRSRSIHPGLHPAPMDREGYAPIAENGFRLVSASPRSTFSIDVDRASYSNVRRFITSGRRPPVDAVRIEEMVNYFPYRYAPPRGEHPFTVTSAVATAPWAPGHRIARIALQGGRIAMEDAPPANFVFLLDVSGSMQSPDKLPLLKSSFRLLVNELRDDDRVAIVVYAGAAGVVLESTPGHDKTRILDAIDRLEAGGSTAGGAGIRLAYAIARRHHIPEGNNRVILATDGDFNVGPSSDGEMVRLIEQQREQGTFLTVLGFGTGNLQDAKMEQIADHGNGNFAYIDNLLEARKVLVTEMGGTLVTIAQDVKLQVEFNPARVAAYRLIGYENRLLADEDFNDDTKDAGELGAGHAVTALYEIVPAGVTLPPMGRVDSLRYRRPPAPRTGPASEELFFVRVRYKDPAGSTSRLLEHVAFDRVGPVTGELAFAAAVAGFGMLLRDSPHCGDLTLDDVQGLARTGLAHDPHGYRAEFLRLVALTSDRGWFTAAP